MSEEKLFENIRCSACGHEEQRFHYTIGRVLKGCESLRSMFPNGEANDLNFVLFSTSGVHGSYTTLDDIEASIEKYGFEYVLKDDDDYPDDYHSPSVTILVVHPRVVALRYGNAKIETLEDLEFLKKLRASSTAVVQGIGYSGQRNPL
jgi:hypothetical protein